MPSGVIPDKEKVLKRLNEYKYITPEGHWRWFGSINKRGYGVITINYVTYYIHRLSAYIYLDLDISNELDQANHKRDCPFKDCWNPDHLYVGKQYDNMQDVVARTDSRTHFPKCGHEITESNTRLVWSRSKYTKHCRRCYLEYMYDYNHKLSRGTLNVIRWEDLKKEN